MAGRRLPLPARPARRWPLVRFFSGVVVVCLIVASAIFLPHVLARPKPTPSPVLSPILAKTLTTIITQHSSYKIGVALEDISSDTTQTFGATTPFVAASTSKVLVACAYYHLVETGQATLTDMLGAYPAQFQLKEMVNDSSNDSWHLLTAAIGDDKLQSYAQSIGIPYDETTNSLTPQAMATLLAKLYKGTLLNQADTAQLLNYMQQTNDEELIPAALPQDVTVYHKYGELNSELHDAAIIVYGHKAYSLVIYTENNTTNGSIDTRPDLIHQLTHSIVAVLFPAA